MVMLTHAQIWSAIDGLAERYGLSPSGLAKRAGLDPTTFNKSKRITPDGRARWPSTESVAKSLAATGTSLDVRRLGSNRPAARRGARSPAARLRRSRRRRLFRRWRVSRRQRLGRDRLPAVNDEHAYALEISGQSMDPAYRDGDIIMVSPAVTDPPRRPRRGQDPDGEVMAKEFKRRRRSRWN